MPRLKRMLLRARAALQPIAVNTCEGSSEPVVQAEPLEAQMPAWSNNIRMPSASTPSKARLLVLGRRGSLAPLRDVPGMASRIPSSNLSRSARTRLFSSGTLARASSAARPKATMLATFSVPPPRPRSRPRLPAGDHVGLIFDPSLHVEQPDAFGSVQLVRRQRQEVHIQLPHIDLQLARRLHRIDRKSVV